MSGFGPGSAQLTDEPVRCPECKRKLIEMATRPWAAVCPRCHCRATATPEGGVQVTDHGKRYPG